VLTDLNMFLLGVLLRGDHWAIRLYFGPGPSFMLNFLWEVVKVWVAN